MKAASSVEFVEEAEGWELHVVDSDGEHHAWNIHHLAWPLIDHAYQTLGRWGAEGAAVGTPDLVTDEDLEAYEPGDPKRIALSDDARAAVEDLLDDDRFKRA